MADSSFDVVSKVDRQEVDNALNQVAASAQGQAVAVRAQVADLKRQLSERDSESKSLQAQLRERDDQLAGATSLLADYKGREPGRVTTQRNAPL